MLKILYRLNLYYMALLVINGIRYKSFIRECKKMQVDLIYTPTTFINFYIRKIPTVVSLHDCQECTFPKNFSNSNLIYRRKHRLFTLRFAKRIQTSSEFIKNEILKYHTNKIDAEKIFVVNEGVDCLIFKHIEYKNIETCRIFYPASFLPHKNHNFLLGLDKNDLLPYKVTFVFTGGSNPNRLAFEKAWEKTRIPGEFLGELSDHELLKQYIESKIVVVTSKYESSSLPLIEARSIGRHALASDIPPHKEMSDCLEINLYKEENLPEFVKILRLLISSKPIREKNIEYWTWNCVAQRFLAEFQKLIASH